MRACFSGGPSDGGVGKGRAGRMAGRFSERISTHNLSCALFS